VVAARRRKRRRRRFGEEGVEEFERGIVVDAVHLFHCRLRLRPTMGETKMVRESLLGRSRSVQYPQQHKLSSRATEPHAARDTRVERPITSNDCCTLKRPSRKAEIHHRAQCS
jgi:hypothetical protein